MIGLDIIINRAHSKIIFDFLNLLGNNTYNFLIKEQEIITSNEEVIMLNCEYKSDEIKDCFKNLDAFIYFLNIQVFPETSDKKEIKNYTDFENSDCKFLLLVSDGSNIEIYCKDINLLNNIINYMKENKIGKIYIKTKKTDGRTVMEL